MNSYCISTPWAGPSRLYNLPGQVIVKLALGEAPGSIPSLPDVRSGANAPAGAFGLGAVDRLFHHFADGMRIARVHASADGLLRRGRMHRRFDDVEHAIGLSRTFRVETSGPCCVDDLADGLRQLNVVEEATPNYLGATPFSGDAGPRAFDESYAWRSREMIGAPEAMAYEPGDPAVIVSVVDTGAAQSHLEFNGGLRPGLDTVRMNVAQLASGVELLGDLNEIDADPEDWVGHGTSCAAIIGASGRRIPPGLAGSCGLLPIRVLAAARFPGKKEPVGIGSMADIVLGVKSAIDLGADVVNMSFGTPLSALKPDDPDPHEDVVRYGARRGCVMVAASGNSGDETPYSPAVHKDVIAVGAVDRLGRPAAFSTRGSHVDLAAPGVRIVSAGLTGCALVTGTSFAAPFVAATAGLLVSRAARRSRSLDGATVRGILRDSARPWPGPTPAGCGTGILDAHQALRLLDGAIDRVGHDAPPSAGRRS